MIDMKEIKHDVNRDVHNVMSLLRFINGEVKIEDKDIKSMLEAAINRESELISKINQLTN